MEDYVYQNIRYIRRFHGLTQKEMADIMHIHVSTLRKIEKMDTSVRIRRKMICRLCDYFNLSADALLRFDMEHLPESTLTDP